MKRSIVLVSCAVLLSACSTFHSAFSYLHGEPEQDQAKAKPAPALAAQLVDANGVPIERIAFRAGISSATVERMAKLKACRGGEGAGLVTEPGPVEVYRMACDNGKMFMARCELRQCKPM